VDIESFITHRRGKGVVNPKPVVVGIEEENTLLKLLINTVFLAIITLLLTVSSKIVFKVVKSATLLETEGNSLGLKTDKL
jgi:hypothetical protein